MMKFNRRLIAFFTVAIMAVAALSTMGFADDDSVDYRVRITTAARSVRVDNDVSLNTRIVSDSSFSYTGGYSWSSDNERVATVDSGGTVTGKAPGVATIRVQVDNGRSDSCTITVTGSARDYYDYYYDYDYDYYGYDRYRPYGWGWNPYDPNSPYYDEYYESSRSRSSSSSRSSSAATADDRDAVKLSDRADRDTVLSKVRSADGSTAVLKNYASVSAETLQAAAAASSSSIAFDTTSGKMVVGRMVFRAANASQYQGNIDTGVYCDTGNTSAVKKKFAKGFTNQLKVVLIDQESFAAPVEICVNVGSMKVSDLYFYSYDRSSNIYKPLAVDNVYKDSKDFLHFTTSRGGYIIVSDGRLSTI